MLYFTDAILIEMWVLDVFDADCKLIKWYNMTQQNLQNCKDGWCLAGFPWQGGNMYYLLHYLRY